MDSTGEDDLGICAADVAEFDAWLVGFAPPACEMAVGIST